MLERPLKREARVLGVDDGPYIRGSGQTIIVMIVYRLDGYIDGILTGRICTDGHDAANVIAEKIIRSRFGTQIRCILSDGACLGGFNVLDMGLLLDLTGIPVVTTSDERPRTDSLEKALREHFPDWKMRLDLILENEPHELSLPDGTCYVREKGITPNMADDVVRRSTIRGRNPEPIRLSHMIAASIHEQTMR